MSDTFDHEGDAWESLDIWDADDHAYESSLFGSSVNNSADYFISTNSHRKVGSKQSTPETVKLEYTKKVAETAKAYLLEVEIKGYPQDVWLPKSLCWEMSGKGLLVPKVFWEQKLKEVS